MLCYRSKQNDNSLEVITHPETALHTTIDLHYFLGVGAVQERKWGISAPLFLPL